MTPFFFFAISIGGIFQGTRFYYHRQKTANEQSTYSYKNCTIFRIIAEIVEHSSLFKMMLSAKD